MGAGPLHIPSLDISTRTINLNSPIQPRTQGLTKREQRQQARAVQIGLKNETHKLQSEILKLKSQVKTLGRLIHVLLVDYDERTGADLLAQARAKKVVAEQVEQVEPNSPQS